MNSLVLSSGGLFAGSHIGVIKYLIEKGVQIDHVVGCSGGALVAAFWALKWNSQEIINELESYNLHLYDVNWFNLKSGFLKGQRILHRLRQIFPGNVGDYPVTIMITSLGQQKAISAPSDMPLADAVRASISIPVVFVPHQWGGDRFMDGGLGGLLPLEGIPNSTTKVISSRIDDHMSAMDAHNSMLSAIYASYSIIVSDQTDMQAEAIRKSIPDYTEISHTFTSGNSLTSFSKIREYAQIGYDDAKKIIG